MVIEKKKTIINAEKWKKRLPPPPPQKKKQHCMDPRFKGGEKIMFRLTKS